MSIQRWDIWGYEWEQDPHPEGDWVKYDDHVAAVKAEAESAHDLGVIYGINHERARIRQAVEGIRHLLEGATVEEVLSIIDGEQA